MMKDFESETRHKKYLNNIKNKWRSASCKYKEKMEYIRNRNEKLDKMRDKAFRKRYIQKEKAIRNQLELKSHEKTEEKKKNGRRIKKEK